MKKIKFDSAKAIKLTLFSLIGAIPANYFLVIRYKDNTIKTGIISYLFVIVPIILLSCVNLKNE